MEMSLDGSLVATYRDPQPRTPLLTVSAEQTGRPENWQLLMLVEKVYLSQGRLAAWRGTWATELTHSPASCVNLAPTAAPCHKHWVIAKEILAIAV